MPEIEDAAIALRENPGQGAWQQRVMRSAAIVIAVPLWLGACAPADQSAPAPLASPSAPIIAEPSAGPIASPGSPITAEPSAGPIALAPSMTGTPVPAPAPPLPEPAPAVAAPEPLPPPAPAVAMPQPPPAPAPAVAAAAETPTAPSPCPPGQIAVISKPDMAGTPVVLCRRRYQ